LHQFHAQASNSATYNLCPDDHLTATSCLTYHITNPACAV
jgi:hypothetical protein